MKGRRAKGLKECGREREREKKKGTLIEDTEGEKEGMLGVNLSKGKKRRRRKEKRNEGIRNKKETGWKERRIG